MSSKRIEYPEVGWPAAGNESAAVKLCGVTICGMYIPSGFAGSSITLLASWNGVNFSPVKDGAGGDVSYTVAPNDFIRVKPGDFAGIEHFKIRSIASEAAGRMIRLAVREIE